MKQVLITGGCGFLAAWIARRLVQRGIRLRLFDLHDTRDTVLRIVGPAHAHLLEWQVGDIRQADQVQAAMQGCDGVVHLAGVLTPTCSANPVLGAQVNLLVDMVDQRVQMLEQQLADLQTTISELREIKKLATERLAQAS